MGKGSSKVEPLAWARIVLAGLYVPAACTYLLTYVLTRGILSRT